MALFKKSIVRYVDSDGKRVKKSTPGSQVKNEKSTKWYGRYRLSDGQLKETPLFKDKEAARQELAKLVKSVERQEAGLVDPYAEHRKKPLVCRTCKSTGTRVSDDRPCKSCNGAHLSDFRQHLKATGAGARHIAATIRHVRRITIECGFDTIFDIDASAVETCLQQFRDGESNMSIGTSNQHVTAIKSFTRWLVIKAKRALVDHLSHIQRLNSETDRRHERRVLSDEEFTRFLDAAENGEPIRRISGHDRAMLYRFAAFTGLRAAELASLTRASLDLYGDVPTVTIRAENSKSRRTDVLPLHPDLASALREWLADDDEPDVISLAMHRSGSQRTLWPQRWAEQCEGARLVRRDLKTAGIPYADENGLVFDFHALRSQFITGLGRSGVPLQVAQKLARHRDPKLTANIYTKMGVGELADAVAKLPGFKSTGS